MDRRSLLIGSITMIGAGGLTGCAGGFGEIAEDRPSRAVPVDTTHAQILVNAYRADHGLPALRLDQRLNQAAQDMAFILARLGTMKTREHSARRLAARLDEQGYDALAAAENIGAGYSSLEAAMVGWKGSSDHDKNLKNTFVTRFGVARADSEGGTWTTFWAMIFALPREDYRSGVTLGGAVWRP